MLGQVLIVDLDYFFIWGLLVETKFISTNMLVYNDVRLCFDNSSFPITNKLSIDRSAIHVAQFLQYELG